MDNNRRDDSDSEGEEMTPEERLRFMQQREAFLARFLRTVFYERASANRNEDLIANLKESGTLTDARVEQALLAIPRGFFVTPDLKEEAYIDSPLRFAKMGFNISAPHMYAMCLQNLDIQPGTSVLDIGSGSGHLTALAGYLTGPTGVVHGLDLYDHIIEFSVNNLKEWSDAQPSEKKISLSHVKFFKRNCFLPSPEPMLYDRIHAGCCCPESHIQYLYDLLKPGGILVTPFGDKLVKATKSLTDPTQVTMVTLVSVRYSDLTLPSDAEIKEAQKEIARAKANQIVVPQTTIHTQFRGLLANCKVGGTYGVCVPDMVFIVEGKPMPCHKLLFVTRSSYFRGILSDYSKKEMEIPGIPTSTFAEIVEFVYTDQYTSSNEEALFHWANKLEFSSLVAKIEKKGKAATLVDDLGKLVNNKDFSDVTFVVEGKEVPSHKMILELRSEHFRCLFSSGLREAVSKKIEIPDCTESVFLDVLQFIYTDYCEVNDDNCISLLEQGNFFQLDRLKAICEQFWYHNISVSNAASVLQVADHCNAKQLKDFALEFIFKNIREVVQTQAFKELDPSLVSAILIASVERSK